MPLVFSEILHVPLVNAYKDVSRNCFVFPASVNIKKNVKTFGFHMLREVRFFVSHLQRDNIKQTF